MTEEKKTEEVASTDVTTQEEPRADIEAKMEPQAKTEIDTKTLKTESGKEIKLNFIDEGDRKEENKAAENAGVDHSKPSEEITLAEKVQRKISQVNDKMGHVDTTLGQFGNMLGHANMEVSGLITALLVRGLITHKELQHGMELVQKKMQEEVEKQEKGPQSPEIIRQKPTGHGDNGIIMPGENNDKK